MLKIISLFASMLSLINSAHGASTFDPLIDRIVSTISFQIRDSVRLQIVDGIIESSNPTKWKFKSQKPCKKFGINKLDIEIFSQAQGEWSRTIKLCDITLTEEFSDPDQPIVNSSIGTLVPTFENSKKFYRLTFEDDIMIFIRTEILNGKKYGYIEFPFANISYDLKEEFDPATLSSYFTISSTKWNATALKGKGISEFTFEPLPINAKDPIISENKFNENVDAQIFSIVNGITASLLAVFTQYWPSVTLVAKESKCKNYFQQIINQINTGNSQVAVKNLQTLITKIDEAFGNVQKVCDELN
jgi:hypothetical protein